MRLPRNKTQRINIQKVLFAVHLMADEEGLRCTAINADIAKVAGLSKDTTISYIHRLASMGEFAIVGHDPADGYTRSIYLLDHPEAAKRIELSRSRGAGILHEV